LSTEYATKTTGDAFQMGRAKTIRRSSMASKLDHMATSTTLKTFTFTRKAWEQVTIGELVILWENKSTKK